MKVTTEILKKLKEDANFRMKVAIALNVGERNVQELIKRDSDNLTKYGAIKVFLEAGYTIEQIVTE